MFIYIYANIYWSTIYCASVSWSLYKIFFLPIFCICIKQKRNMIKIQNINENVHKKMFLNFGKSLCQIKFIFYKIWRYDRNFILYRTISWFVYIKYFYLIFYFIIPNLLFWLCRDDIFRCMPNCFGNR